MRQERNEGASLPLLVAGVIFTFFVGYAVAYALPQADPSLSTVSSHTQFYTKKTSAGKAIYDREGCWYCHTQEVRPVANDLGLGTVSLPDRYVHDERSSIGMARIGPDLTCVGDRFKSAAEVRSYLLNPKRAEVSIMPKLAYLSDKDLSVLSDYLAALRCRD